MPLVALLQFILGTKCMEYDHYFCCIELYFGYMMNSFKTLTVGNRLFVLSFKFHPPPLSLFTSPVSESAGSHFPYAYELCDLIRLSLIVTLTFLLNLFDSSVFYHEIRSQSVIKIYLFFNLLEVCRISLAQKSIESCVCES